MTRDEARAYLAAFIDGEGHIGCHITARGRSTKTIEFSNTDKQLFDRVVEIGAVLDLHFRVYNRPGKKENWAHRYEAFLSGGRKAFELFQQTVPLQAERKRRALDDLIHSYVGDERIEEIYASRRTSVPRLCGTCSKEFFAFPADIKRRAALYCSMKCAGIGRSEKYPINCQTCGNVFFVNKARTHTARFCSQRCGGIAKSDRLRAQANKASNARWHPDRN